MIMDNTNKNDTSWIVNFTKWREQHISAKNFTLILAVMVGLCSAFAALILKTLIHAIQHFLTENFHINGANYLYLLYPVVGIFLAGLFIRYVVRDDIGHGVTKILYAISRKQARIRSHNMYSSVVASSITIGFGGSVGAEAPIVLTGSAIGSNLGRLFRVDARTMMLLVGCGAAGAVSGIFKAPIAGLVFTIEVLLIDLTMSSLMPLLISSVTAATVSYICTGTDSMFHFTMANSFTMQRIPYVMMLGIACGLVSLYFSSTMNRLEDIFRRFKNPYMKLLIGGVTLSLLIFLFPSLYGEGYDTIELLLNGKDTLEWDAAMDNSFFYEHSRMLLVYLALVVLFKVFATTATNGGGGCGGIFAPSLFLGCITGFVFSHLANQMGISVYLPENNFALFGMAGLMSGVMHAPLTGIFLIAELTGGYDLFLPLMITSVFSYLTIRVFQSHSIYSMRLAKKGELLTHHKDQSILTLMRTENVIERDFKPTTVDMELGRLTTVISDSRRNLFPVLNKDNRLVGVVQLDDVRHYMFRSELYRRYTVDKFMREPAARISVNDAMDVVMRKFDATHAWNLPVEDEDGRYLGFVSRSKIFNEYRRLMLDYSDE